MNPTPKISEAEWINLSFKSGQHNHWRHWCFHYMICFCLCLFVSSPHCLWHLCKRKQQRTCWQISKLCKYYHNHTLSPIWDFEKKQTHFSWSKANIMVYKILHIFIIQIDGIIFFNHKFNHTVQLPELRIIIVLDLTWVLFCILYLR